MVNRKERRWPCCELAAMLRTSDASCVKVKLQRGFDSLVITFLMPGEANLADNSAAEQKAQPSGSSFSRSLQLSNSLKIQLFSNPSLTEVSVSLNVKVGHFDDPDELPGLSHFCEHLLFMGNEKYPEEHGLDVFLAENGGYCSATTKNIWTCYYFKVDEKKFEEALDQVAHMFLSPLFTQGAIEREVSAVDCEFRDSQHVDDYTGDNQHVDDYREWHLNGTLSPPGHNARKIYGGNRQTLMEIPASKGINVREEVAATRLDVYGTPTDQQHAPVQDGCTADSV
uniref:Peptidase_M16 domain-containing protein n=1 Tax=Steinernema glaseri TaxID=37863 RepID=A0A1I7Y1U4_9BILA